ncbi:DUF1822 family protein [Coleofasciculus sp. FACHB-712]|uniref:DUF1822 family protein n=1 Tax=Coleofasciculus sp. FACHB-712 TaxID=2692789 RepID=UPI00168547D7|nr:DUF1822 family protein [Coleofasciculus sp. FACHB-712]MBD1944366.1 DUF1822 family protein [Coleofasciculus sp. FACHB-712]
MAAVTSNINQARAMRVAVKRIEGFAKQFGEAHRSLARHAAFPLVLTPDLLYQIWANFVPEGPWTAVAHVLLSRLCRQVGYEMYEMDISDRNLLLRELKEQFGQERLDKLGEFLLDYVAQRLTEDDPDTQDLREAQEWTALAYTQPTEAANELAEALSLRVKQEDMAEVFRLASLVETLAEPLIEAGFEPLLIYGRGVGNFFRGEFVAAATEFNKVSGESEQLKVANVNLPIPKQKLEKTNKHTSKTSPNNQLVRVQLVVLKVEDGNFETGFPASLQIREEESLPFTGISGSLPPASEIPDLYRRWQAAYQRIVTLKIKPEASQSTNISNSSNQANDIEDLVNNLRVSLNNWLNSEQFRPIKEAMLSRLQPSDEVRVILQTRNSLLQRLPWQLWNFFEDYPKAELVLSAPTYEGEVEKSIHFRKKIRILAILGDSTGINLESDRRLLEKLPNTETFFLIEPQQQEVDIQIRDEQGWDILFFAGHSSSQNEVGKIYINKLESLTIEHLKKSFKKAVARGLQLVIFNSSEGLALGRELVSLHIPLVIVMRELLPDRVAEEFLKYFLEAFSGGQSFYASVRRTREILQELEAQFPLVSLLPVILQNPAIAPPTWQELLNKKTLASPDLEVRDEKQEKVKQSLQINLSQWFQNVFGNGWKKIEDIWNKTDRLNAADLTNNNFNNLNPVAELINILKSNQDLETSFSAIDILDRIAQGNSEAIAALTELLQTTQDYELRRRAAVSLGQIDPGNVQAGVQLARVINLGMQPHENQVILMISVIPEADNKANIQSRVLPAENQTYLPPNLKLIVLDENEEIFLEAQSRIADNWIQLTFIVESGNKFSIKVALEDTGVTEYFVI